MAKLNFGLKILCGMPTNKRLDLIAEGLPIILESARGFWSASGKLADKPREADVLKGFAEEEAAKALILMDVVRCPSKLVSQRLGSIVWNFYDHLARLIYAKAQGWSAMHVSQLREYVDQDRKAHYLEGYVGEYILPNWNVAAREMLLYADIEAYEDEVPHWNKPTSHTSGLPRFTPMVLEIVEALSAVGVFSRKGLDATAEIWGHLDFKDTQTHADARRLMKQLWERLVTEKLPSEATTQQDVNVLYEYWQMPMYNLDFKLIDVPLAELQEEREAIMWTEARSY